MQEHERQMLKNKLPLNPPKHLPHWHRLPKWVNSSRTNIVIIPPKVCLRTYTMMNTWEGVELYRGSEDCQRNKIKDTSNHKIRQTNLKTTNESKWKLQDIMI